MVLRLLLLLFLLLLVSLLLLVPVPVPVPVSQHLQHFALFIRFIYHIAVRAGCLVAQVKASWNFVTPGFAAHAKHKIEYVSKNPTRCPSPTMNPPKVTHQTSRRTVR
ncbi:hypothetical protein AWZ03_010719 [Drosophila navojoa]|uniref:Uncharacterized protein n=1 Tax=Drosophila navojoa TaxID=7232 RepID=A0A484B2A4_DRONA|nr:hypothetical protein AWZ03_010719 [Drosophila navojoa]